MHDGARSNAQLFWLWNGKLVMDRSLNYESDCNTSWRSHQAAYEYQVATMRVYGATSQDEWKSAKMS